MPDASLQRIDDFNNDVAALASTGVPIDMGNLGGESVAETLEKIHNDLQRRIGRGQTVDQAIADLPELPTVYRNALTTWLRCPDPTIALDAITTPALAQRHFGGNLSQALVYPMILLSLAYVGFLYLCSITAPKIEDIYTQLGFAPSDSLSLLTMGRSLMPVWGPLVPLLVVLTIAWWRCRGSRRKWAWLPGSGKYYASIRNATFARQMARLMSSGVPQDESLALAMPLLGSDKATDGPVGAPSIENLPSLLRWALQGDLGGEPRSRALQMVAETYRKTAERQAAIWRVAVPAIFGVLLGGVFVFAYGLSVFYPVIALLRDLTLAGGS